MLSNPGGTMDSVELTTVRISLSSIYISGSLLSNDPGNDELVPFELDCAFVNQSDVLFEGLWKVYDSRRSVVFLANDTSANWWLTPLTYLDVSLQKGEPVWYQGARWEFVSWNRGRRQVTLQKEGSSKTKTEQVAKNCLKKTTQRRGLDADDHDDNELTDLGIDVLKLDISDTSDSKNK